MPDQVGVVNVVCTDCGLRSSMDEVVATPDVWRIYPDAIRCPDCTRRKDDP